MEQQTDFRRSAAGRKQSWRGAKKYVKRFLGLRVPHFFLRLGLRLRPRLRETGRLPAPAHLKEVQGRVLESRFVMLRPAQCVVAKELYWGRGVRPRAADRFALEVFARLARASDVVLDVGAYTGIFTLASVAVNPEIEVHAFEIVPDVYKALFDNCVRNRVLHRTTLHHVGLGAPDQLVELPADSIGSALPDFYSTKLRFDEGVPVRLRSLDWCAGLVPKDACVLMKIDVEGTEAEILGNGQGFLAEHRPAILCEVLHGVAEPVRLNALLRPFDYHVYLVRDDELAHAASIEPNERYRDWLFTVQTPDELRGAGLTVTESAP